jgi:hypothetical protein
MSTSGTDAPDAGGYSSFFFDSDTGKLYFDNGTWVQVGSTSISVLDDLDDSDVPLSGTHTGTLSSAKDVADAMDVLDDLNDADIPLAAGPLDVYTGCLSSATTVKDAMDALDGIDDSEVAVGGTHSKLLAAATDVSDAMDVLDALDGADIDIDDEDIDVTGGYSGILSGDTTLDAALDTLDGLSDLNIPLSGAALDQYTGHLASADTVREAMDALDSIPAIINASSEVDVGSEVLPLNLLADGVIDAGANDIETTGDVECANTIAPFDRATKTTTLTDNVGATILKLPLDSGKATSCNVYWEVEATTGTAIEFASGNVRFSAQRLAAGTTVTTPVEFGRDNGLIGSMTVTFASSSASAVEGRLQIVANTSLTGATITLRVRADSGSPTQPVWNF